MNRYLDVATHRLLQDLTATGAELEYHSDKREWFYNRPGRRKEQLPPGKSTAAKKCLELCLLETVLNRHPVHHYKISSEGTSVLLKPDYQPIMLRPRK